MNEEEKEIIQRIQQDSTFRERSLLRIIEKQQTTINTMQAEFERLEDLEDNTDMLKMELEKKDKIIDFMAKKINEAYFGSGDFEEWFENKICKVLRYEDYTYLEEDIKQYFKNKSKEDK